MQDARIARSASGGCHKGEDKGTEGRRGRGEIGGEASFEMRSMNEWGGRIELSVRVICIIKGRWHRDHAREVDIEQRANKVGFRQRMLAKLSLRFILEQSLDERGLLMLEKVVARLGLAGRLPSERIVGNKERRDGRAAVIVTADVVIRHLFDQLVLLVVVPILRRDAAFQRRLTGRRRGRLGLRAGRQLRFEGSDTALELFDVAVRT